AAERDDRLGGEGNCQGQAPSNGSPHPSEAWVSARQTGEGHPDRSRAGRTPRVGSGSVSFRALHTPQCGVAVAGVSFPVFAASMWSEVRACRSGEEIGSNDETVRACVALSRSPTVPPPWSDG